jgi:hypothetical protein
MESKGVLKMPHVVLEGKLEFRDIFDALLPISIRDEKKILKTSTKYIDSEENSILVEALAIEGGKKSSFIALLGKREDGLVIRIYPELNIEKTDGIKNILAEIAKQLIQKFPNLKIGKTNLQDFLPING